MEHVSPYLLAQLKYPVLSSPSYAWGWSFSRTFPLVLVTELQCGCKAESGGARVREASGIAIMIPRRRGTSSACCCCCCSGIGFYCWLRCVAETEAGRTKTSRGASVSAAGVFHRSVLRSGLPMNVLSLDGDGSCRGAVVGSAHRLRESERGLRRKGCWTAHSSGVSGVGGLLFAVYG